jgi:hypothetical protein
VDRAVVQEARGEQPPRLALVDQRSEQHAADVDLAAAVQVAPSPPAPVAICATKARTLSAMIA